MSKKKWVNWIKTNMILNKVFLQIFIFSPNFSFLLFSTISAPTNRKNTLQLCGVTKSRLLEGLGSEPSSPPGWSWPSYSLSINLLVLSKRALNDLSSGISSSSVMLTWHGRCSTKQWKEGENGKGRKNLFFSACVLVPDRTKAWKVKGAGMCQTFWGPPMGPERGFWRQSYCDWGQSPVVHQLSTCDGVIR